MAILWTHCPICMNHQDHSLLPNNKWKCDRCGRVNKNIKPQGENDGTNTRKNREDTKVKS